jgi:hypothetical protein
MPEEHWGVKRTCPKCEVRFYDLKKDPMVCPICDHTFSLESLLENFKKPPKEVGSKKTPAASVPDEVSDIEGDDIPDIEEDDDDIILDDSDSTVTLEDDLLDEDEDDSSPIDGIADVKKGDDDT